MTGLPASLRLSIIPFFNILFISFPCGSSLELMWSLGMRFAIAAGRLLSRETSADVLHKHTRGVES